MTVTNVLSTAITSPIYLVVGNLSSNTTLKNSAGTTVNAAPVGSPYVLVSGTGLGEGASAVVSLQFSAPTSGAISNTLSTAITTNGTP